MVAEPRPASRVEYKWLVAACFLFAIFMDLMDITIVNVALATLGRVFNAGNSSLEWVVTGYLLSLAVWIPASGWLGDRIGTKKVFLFALAVFVAGSTMCALSWSIGSLIAFRVFQGVGGGMLTPVGTTMLFRAFPPHERAKASIVLTVPTVIAPALGPILGGFFVDYVSWHWIFLVNVPIGICGFIFSVLFLKEERMGGDQPFDIAGFLLSASGLVLVLFALTRAPEAGWLSLQVAGTGALGTILLIAFALTEWRSHAPMLDLRLLKDRMFRNANVVMFAMMGGLMGVLFLLPLLLQDLRNFSAIKTGAILVPQAVAVAVVAPLAGTLYPKLGPRKMLAFAMIIFTISSALLMLIDLQTTTFWIAAILVLRGVAMAFTFIPLQAATYSTIAREDTGQASSISNTNRQVASSFGVAILATVLISRTHTHVAAALAAAPPAAREAAAAHGALLAYHDAFFASVVLSLIGLAFTLIIRDEDAAASMSSEEDAEWRAAAG